jgi:hypothetical protein
VCCEADGVKLENCTPYIREWMEREKGLCARIRGGQHFMPLS